MDPIAVSFNIDGKHFSVDYGDTLYFGKCQLTYLVIPVTHNMICSGMIADKIFNLLCQRRRSVGDNGYFFFRR